MNTETMRTKWLLSIIAILAVLIIVFAVVWFRPWAIWDFNEYFDNDTREAMLFRTVVDDQDSLTTAQISELKRALDTLSKNADPAAIIELREPAISIQVQRLPQQYELAATSTNLHALDLVFDQIFNGISMAYSFDCDLRVRRYPSFEDAGWRGYLFPDSDQVYYENHYGEKYGVSLLCFYEPQGNGTVKYTSRRRPLP